MILSDEILTIPGGNHAAGSWQMVKIPCVRVVKTKHDTYSLHFTSLDGRRRRRSAGKDERRAQRLANRFTDILLEGGDPEQKINAARRPKMLTLRQFYPLFVRLHSPYLGKKTQERYQICFRNICRFSKLADLPIDQISKSQAIDYMNARIQNGVTPSTANREAAFLRGMLSRAVEWDMLERNPLAGLRLFREPRRREVNISPAQVTALLEELKSPLTDIVELAICTGFRKENILSLKIKQIRFHDLKPTGEADLIIKGDRQETFQVSPQAVEVLKRAIGDRQEGHVFLNPRTGRRYVSIHQSFDAAVNRAGLSVNGTKFRFHDLRHIFATWLYKEGASFETLQILLGHKNVTTTERYVCHRSRAVGETLNLMPRIRG